jgi:hypothetical protein
LKSISFIVLFLLSVILSHAQDVEVTLTLTDGTQDKRIVSSEKLLTANKVQLPSGETLELAKLKSIEMSTRLFEIKKVRIDLAHYEMESRLYEEQYVADIRDSLMILEKFVGGKISLYATPPEGNTFYFAEKEGKPIVELKTYMTKRTADGAILRYDVFRNALTTLTEGCPQITPEQVSNTRLDLKSIRKLVVQYNKACGFESYIAKKEKSRLRVSPGIFAGYLLSQVDFHVHQAGPRKYPASGSANQSGYSLGLSLKIPVRIWFGKVWIETTHTVSRISGGGEFTDAQLDPIYYHQWYYKTQYSFEANHFRNLFGLNVALGKSKKIKPFIGGGLGVNFSTKFNSSMHLSGYTLEGSVENQIPEETTNGLSPDEYVKKVTGSYYVSAGLSYSRFSLRYQFEAQPKITSGDTFRKYNLNRITLGFFFL